MGVSNSWFDTRGKGRGESAVERNTSRPNETWKRRPEGRSEGNKKFWDTIESTRNKINKK